MFMRMRPHFLRAALAFAASCVLATPSASAQGVLLRGSIVDTLARPITGAEVLLQRRGQADRMARTDSTGRFSISDIVPGDWAIIARAIGRVPSTDRVRLAPNDTVDADIVLYPVATTLATQRVTGRGGDASLSSLKLREFAERKASGTGMYWSAEDFARRPAPDSPSLVGRLPFMRVTTDRWGRERFGFTRGALSFERCGELYFWDGVMTDGAQIAELLRATPPEFLAGIEMYRSAATIPARFAMTGGACGVIAFWTK